MSASSGFTLSELLISLGILAIIATFTIPKILSSQQDVRKKAVFKETIALASSLASLADQLKDTSYFRTHINAVKICSSNSSSEGCFPSTYLGPGGENTQPGFLLHNGAGIAGFGGYTYSDGLAIDWNGNDPPNLYGDDQIRIDVCFDQGAGCAFTGPAGKIRTGDTTSQALYNYIFAN